MKLPPQLVLVLGALAPGLLALSAGVDHPQVAALLQILGIVAAGLSGHAMPQPKWAVNKPLIPATFIASATLVDGVLVQLAGNATGAVAKTVLFALACVLAWVAGLHAPAPVQPAQGAA